MSNSETPNINTDNEPGLGVFPTADEHKRRTLALKAEKHRRALEGWVKLGRLSNIYGAFSIPTVSFLLLIITIHNISVFMGPQSYFMVAGMGVWIASFIGSAIKELRSEEEISTFSAFYWASISAVTVLNYPITSFYFLLGGGSTGQEMLKALGYLTLTIMPISIMLGKLYGKCIKQLPIPQEEKLEWCFLKATRAALVGGIVGYLLISSGHSFNVVFKLGIMGLIAALIAINYERKRWYLKLVLIVGAGLSTSLFYQASGKMLLVDIGDNAYDIIGSRSSEDVQVNKNHLVIAKKESSDKLYAWLADELSKSENRGRSTIVWGETLWSLGAKGEQGLNAYHMIEHVEIAQALIDIHKLAIHEKKLYFGSAISLPARLDRQVDQIIIDGRSRIDGNILLINSPVYLMRLAEKINPDGSIFIAFNSAKGFKESLKSGAEKSFKKCEFNRIAVNEEIMRCVKVV